MAEYRQEIVSLLNLQRPHPTGDSASRKKREKRSGSRVITNILFRSVAISRSSPFSRSPAQKPEPGVKPRICGSCRSFESSKKPGILLPLISGKRKADSVFRAGLKSTLNGRDRGDCWLRLPFFCSSRSDLPKISQMNLSGKLFLKNFT